MKDRRNYACECDHLRPVIKDGDGNWRHIGLGDLGSICGAGVYRVEATYSGEHFVSDLISEVF